MNVPGYSKLNQAERDILHAFLEQQGIKVDKASLTDAPADALGINWCKILCGIKAAAAVVACGGNPVCIAAAVAQGVACVAACK